ncbi:microneme protein 7, putative [Eimeria mitis]|uniref:Microneme protein 7, putative n=1 Tax=Eimeria mitis TaxID=44415 RepID=U6KEC7_9EIME|nr:microneme protein 7, putative [Eimeria mitis]CDJ36309.1 microneme protein 7, putative [Eimeria mitis]
MQISAQEVGTEAEVREVFSCDTGGYAHCQRVEYAESCQAGDGFWCTCQKGFSPQGVNQSSTCVDIDECAQGLDNCKQKGGDCVNTPGSFTCGCGPYRQERDGICVDINECSTNRGECDENSDCINVDGSEQLCKCHKGWTDINECNENPAICPSNSICTNLPGSYKCECGPGFEPDSSGSGCVTEDFCGTGKNDCDSVFATCSLVPGSFKCECIQGFRGVGTVNTCEPLAGNEDLACTALGLTCGDYKYCTKSTTQAGMWECADKAASEQLAVFLTNGSTSDTPSWIWAVVVLSTIVLILISGGILWCLYKRFIKKSEENEEDLLTEQDIGEGYNYGATQGYYA